MKTRTYILLGILTALIVLWISGAFRSGADIMIKGDQKIYNLLKERSVWKSKFEVSKSRVESLALKSLELEHKYLKAKNKKPVTITEYVYIPATDLNICNQDLKDCISINFSLRTEIDQIIESSEEIQKTDQGIFDQLRSDRLKLYKLAKRKFHLVIGPGLSSDLSGNIKISMNLTFGYSIF